MKKIGILVYDISLTGGAERVAINMANEFSSKYEVHLISVFNENKINFEDEKKYAIYNVSSKTLKITTNLFKLAKRIKKYLLENKIEILFSITAGVNTLAVMATRHTSIKAIYCEHSNLKNRTYGVKHILRQYIGAKCMNKIVTLTEQDKKNFIEIFKINPSKIEVIPNWIDIAEKLVNGYRIDSTKIITVGRLEKVKGHNMLIEVAKKVKEQHKNWSWDLYGDGKYREEIEMSIKLNQLEDFVNLKGNVSNLSEIYNEYSMFVLTSYYEGFPMVLLDAQMADLPIISFDCPTGPAEIIEDNVNGFLIKDYNIDDMADKINELIENNQKRQEFSKNAKKNIYKFSKANVVSKWIDIIEQC